MPRRKRKSIDAKKAPLEFQESPFSGTFHPPSPVFCSDHPATADVVAISEDLPIPWVSPQFSRHPTSITKAKNTRRSRRLANKTVDVNSTSVVTPNHRRRNRINSKLVPLRFHGDKSPEPPSIVEDVTFDENTPPVAGYQSYSHQKQKTLANVNPAFNPDACKQCGDTTEQCTTKCGHLDTGNNNNYDNSVHTHMPVTKTKTGKKEAGKKKKAKSTRLKINLDDLFSDDSEISLLAAQGKISRDSKSRNSSLLSLNHSDLHKGANRSPLKSIPSPHAPNFVQNLPGVSSNNDYGEIPALESCIDEVAALNDSPAYKPDQTGSLASLRLNVSTPRMSSFVSEKHKSQSDPDYGSFLTPDRKRRSLRLMHMFFPSTPKQIPAVTQTCNILAYDTPEEDYGLPVRKRYLKGIRPIKINKLKNF